LNQEVLAEIGKQKNILEFIDLSSIKEAKIFWEEK
jgi:hypothetical protein